MATLTVNKNNLIRNIEKLGNYLKKNDIQWSLIVKILSGHKDVLHEILSHPIIKETIHSIGDSRLSNLRNVKRVTPDIVTMYIKPPAIQHVETVIKFADISFNTSYETIQALNLEAKKQNKIHRIIIMLEMGELREGVIRENIIEFYQKVFKLSNISVIGLGTNLGCMYGIEPTYDKLIQLSLYKQLIETTFNRKLEFISGGSSITLPLISKHKIPKAVNHFRIGEAVFMGTTPLTGKSFHGLSTGIFQFEANIIEMQEKESQPDGIISEGNIGHVLDSDLEYPKSYRAILDFGLLDVDVDSLTPIDEDVTFFGTTSDMTVYDLGANLSKSKRFKYRVGEKLCFKPSYMAVARLMNSKFIDKKVMKKGG